MAGERDDFQRTAALKRALSLTTEALDLLDAHGGPADAAAHLDLCRNKLQEELANASPEIS
jgi:hypothetical protein